MKKLPGVKGNTMSAVRVNKARNLLRQLLDRAVKKEWLKDNPVLDVARPELKVVARIVEDARGRRDAERRREAATAQQAPAPTVAER